MDDGVIWEREKWIGKWCWAIRRFESDFMIGIHATFDDHKDSSNNFGIQVGFVWLGVQVYHK